ncbi:MAG: glutaminyl-peptide cyclotransferase, partial [Candidatus Omnitrophota bacterium]
MKIRKLFARTAVPLIFSVLPLNTPVFSETPATARAEEYIENIPVKVVKKIPLPKGYHEGLFFDGVNIWVCNGRGGNVWIVDPSSGAVISEIEPLGPFAEGITNSGDGIFWLTDWETKKLYRFRIEDNGMKAEHEVSFDPAFPAGVAWTGEALYVITWARSVTGTRYHLIKLDGNGVILSGT